MNKLLIGALGLFFAAIPIVAQSPGPDSRELIASLKRDANFEICEADYLYVDSRNGGSKSFVITVFSKKHRNDKGRILAYANRIKSTLKSEDTIAVYFLADKALAKDLFSSENESAKMKSIRGLFFLRRSSKTEIFKYFPSGMKEADVEVLAIKDQQH